MEDETGPSRERVDRKAAIFERSVDLSPEDAKTVAADSLQTGMRKPSSDAVDRERNARAQAQQRAEDEK